MISVSCLDSKILNNNNWYGRFQLIPFKKGEGLTIANALRRTLLTEKSNFCIQWIDFYNAEIPYSILTGMRESIFDILLNLKQILFTSDFIWATEEVFILVVSRTVWERVVVTTCIGLVSYEQLFNIGYICVKGPAVITAKYLKLPKGFKCVDPEKYILTLTDDGIF
nr:RNA polymerase alpha subunit [Trentepohlia sp. YN1317]